MCITFFCTCPEEKGSLKLALAFNREEKTERQTLKFAPFHEDPNIYGGRDVQSGGTWLGINIQTGLLVFLTNFIVPSPYSRQGISRGQLVSQFLVTSFIPQSIRNRTDQIVFQELQELSKRSQLYSPFNLVVCNLRTGNMHYICSEQEQKKPAKLSTNLCYGLSNSNIKQPWQKTQYGIKVFQSILKKIDNLSQSQLLMQMTSLMQNKNKFNDLPGQFSTIFVEPHWSERLSTQRRTKSATLILAFEKQDKIEIVIKEISYGVQSQQEVFLRLMI